MLLHEHHPGVRSWIPDLSTRVESPVYEILDVYVFDCPTSWTAGYQSLVPRSVGIASKLSKSHKLMSIYGMKQEKITKNYLPARERRSQYHCPTSWTTQNCPMSWTTIFVICVHVLENEFLWFFLVSYYGYSSVCDSLKVSMQSGQIWALRTDNNQLSTT